MQQYINQSDRYGHPSLAMPENGYDGSVYYAGWLYQHANHLQVYLFTGRYLNKKITPLQKVYLERYLAMRFMEAYGEQDILFFDWENNEEMYLFLKGTAFPAKKSKRTYSPTTIKNTTLLDLAISYDDDRVAIQLFEAGAKISPAIDAQFHVIHLLARNGLLKHIQRLIAYSPDLIHAKDGYNQTPLLWAASRGHTDVVAFLMTQGANIHLPTTLPHNHKQSKENNRSPLDWAIKGGHTATILILEKAGAKANQPYNTVESEKLHKWIKDGNLQETQQLIHDHPWLLTAVREEGYTALHYAAFFGQQSIVSALIKAGADVNATHEISQHKTALMLAAANNHHSMVKMLLSCGAKNPYAGERGESLARRTFAKINITTLWVLTEKKHYEFNPHRHVKIWLSKDPLVFMNDQNQLRMVRMRIACPNDEINLIYESQLLSADAQQALLKFCAKHTIFAIDVRKIISECKQDTEHQLIKIYEDEISHLDAGGNLAAASDILRWLEPVYRLGTYGDLDVQVSTKGLPKTIPVFGEILLNIGSLLNKDSSQLETIRGNNDVVAVLNPRSEQIKKIHQFIIEACAPAFSAPEAISEFPTSFPIKYEKYNPELTKLKNMYLEKTPRQWRSNIPDFVQGLKELREKLLTHADDLKCIFNFYSLLDRAHLNSTQLIKTRNCSYPFAAARQMGMRGSQALVIQG